jgi:hypothetical protein
MEDDANLIVMGLKNSCILTNWVVEKNKKWFEQFDWNWKEDNAQNSWGI